VSDSPAPALASRDAGACSSPAERLRVSGFTVADGPRWTGDGYYESVVLDPEGNRVELTV
jgi:lactoylglutathione lyase